MSDWSQLPSDLLEQISNRLTLPDVIRLGCVCKPWRLFSIPAHHKGRLPWLILPLEETSKAEGNIWLNSLGFFTILNDTTHHMHIPELLDRRICGSSNGWLVTIHDSADIHLIHPFTRKLIELPSFFEIPGVHGIHFFNGELHYFISDFAYPNRDYSYLETATVVRDNYIKKAIVSSTFRNNPIPNPNPSFVVMGILGEQRCLFFCKPHDSKWQVIRDDNHYSDVIHYKGRFYAIKDTGVIVVVDGLDSGRPITRRLLLTRQEGECDSGDSGESSPFYLVESSGDLLKVVQLRVLSSEGDDEVGQFYKKIGFKVWKLDFQQCKWLEVKNLGDRALFLGSNNSYSVSVADFPSCKGNCIYFTEDLWGKDVGSCDLSIYNLEDFTFDKLQPDVSLFTSPQPIWYASMSM